MAGNTTNLGLYYKDPLTDGNDTFNIQTMLNENWDKLDAAIGDVKTPASKMGLSGDLSIGRCLNVLANIGNVHVWGKRLYELTGVIADATDATATVYLNNGYYLYAKAEIVNGEIVCSEKLERYSSPANYVGYYAYNGVNVYRVTSNSYSSSTGYSFTGILQEVKSQSILGSIVSYVVSTDPNAYPQDGDLDGVHYTYVGVLGDRTRIEVGSYVGTGTYGSSNPNSLTFGFAPKIVELLFMTSKNVGGNYSKSEDLTGNGFARTQDFMVADRLTTEYAQGEGLGYNAYSSYGKKSPDGKTFYWYSSDAGAQCNSSEYVYYYIAIG